MRNNITLRCNDTIGNTAQMEAITHHRGPAMVIAGPGSGKTFVIVQRLKYLIEVMKEDPGKILVITFTKAAAIEMQQRFYKLTDSSYPEVKFGTFHSIFYQIIRQSKSGKDELQIADESFKVRLIKDILEEPAIKSSLKSIGIVISEISDVDIKDILSDISRIKNTGEDINNSIKGSILKVAFPAVFKRYNFRLSEYGKIDFDDMILMCYELLINDKELLQKWQQSFDFFLVDEYQDINKIQFSILKLLSTGTGNVFAVGDDDQSIYGFRGSDPGIMLSFTESFKDYAPKMIRLETNYRCGKRIIESAVKVIEENKMRYRKSVKAFKENPEGFVIPRRYKTKKAQSDAIAAYLNSLEQLPDSFAIIFRTNQEAYNMASALKEYGILTNLDNVSRPFITDEAVKLCISYLSFAYLGNKRSDFLKIMNKPMRYISRDMITMETVNERKLLDNYVGNSKKQREVKKFFKQISMISHMRPGLCVRYLRREVGIDKLYQRSADSLDRFSEMAKEFDCCEDFLKAVREKAEEAENNGNQKKSVRKKNCVNLLTMHGSKGLEYDIVWLPNLNEGIIPSRSAESVSEKEEERRMLYVAMTRAKKALIMSYIAGTEENPMLPTRFLRPIGELWEKKGSDHSSSPSSPSSGSSTISSNSTSSR